MGASYITGNFTEHAFLYDGDNLIDLNSLLSANSDWELTLSADINNSGQIVGEGYINGESRAFLMTPVSKPAIQLYLDINPKKCPNVLNVKSHDFLPVTIMGTEVFDVNEIDVASVDLFGLGPIRSEYKDVATVLIDADSCGCANKGSDGYTDLTLKFDKQAVVAALGEVVDGEEWVLELTGSLHDGTAIIGQDCVVIKNKGK